MRARIHAHKGSTGENVSSVIPSSGCPVKCRPPSPFVTTAAEPQPCPRCHALVLDGWAEGLHARVDAAALNRTGELAMILAGRDTYVLTRGGLVLRTEYRVIHPTGPVLAQHVCGRAVAVEHRAPPGAGPVRYQIPTQPAY
jgi:hypothetical protein